MAAKTEIPTQELTQDDAFTLWLQTVKTVKEITSGKNEGDLKEAVSDMFFAEKTYRELLKKNPATKINKVTETYYVLSGLDKNGKRVYYNDSKFIIAYSPDLKEAILYKSFKEAETICDSNRKFGKNLFHYIEMSVHTFTIDVSEVKTEVNTERK